MKLTQWIALAVFVGALTGCTRRIPYDNPITADTSQPDKVLFDSAINNLERGRYAVARLTLQTMINTYDTSEFLPKAKLAVADSWYQEGGATGLAQAEAEYKDFILFYPTMPEAAEAQEKICQIHYKQMAKPNRDPVHALRADEECRQVLVQFPNSQFAPEVEQTLRNVQEVIAEGEYRVGEFYYKKGSVAASLNRFQNLVDTYPLYSKADLSLYQIGEMYDRLGQQFRPQAVEAYQRIVRDYPLSDLAKNSTDRLNALEAEVPAADPVAVARMEYEKENATPLGIFGQFWGIFKTNPSTNDAAKSGTPASEMLRPTTPINVPDPSTRPSVLGLAITPQPAASDALDTQPDARTPDSAAPDAAPATPQQ